MRRINKSNLSLGDMMEVVAERTLPFLPAATGLGTSSGTATATATTAATAAYGDPMDLSNTETEDLNVINEKTQCHRCQGFSHIARDCTTPNPSSRATQFKSQKRDGGGSQMERRQTQRPQSQRAPRSAQRHQGKRVNTVDDVGSGSGAYYSGEWADEPLSEEEEDGKGPGAVELVGSDCEKCAVMAAGKAGQ